MNYAVTTLIIMKDEPIFNLVKDLPDSFISGPPPSSKQITVCNETFFGHQAFPLK